MIPGWKLRRELRRISEQILSMPQRAIEPALRWKYDRSRWSQIHISGNATPPSDKHCLLLVYQPNGLVGSLITTCKFMASKGYAVTIVANGGLRAEDRAVLDSLVWRILERKNFGYDFGGYRDGIHFLLRERISPRFLVLMNDSVWFPIHKNSTAIESMEASDYDVTGLLLHVPTRNEYDKELNGRRHRRRLSEHIESYITTLPNSTFESLAFRTFWDNYRQTNSKSLTIKRGEIGFSRAMMAAGLSVGALSRRRMFLNEIVNRPDDFLERTLQYAAYSDYDLAIRGKAVLESPRDSDWRELALEHIRSVVERRRFNASFCWATEEIFGTSFIKKHPDRLFQFSRIRFLEAVDNGHIAADNAEALAEIRERAKKDRIALDLDDAE